MTLGGILFLGVSVLLVISVREKRQQNLFSIYFLAWLLPHPSLAQPLFPGFPRTRLQQRQNRGTVPGTRREANARFLEAGYLGTVSKNVLSTYHLGGPSLTIKMYFEFLKPRLLVIKRTL